MTSETIARGATSLLVHLAEPAARAIALGCLAAILLGALRVKRVPVRLLAWTTVLYGAVVIALAAWLLPGMTMRVPGAATAERIIGANAKVANAIQTVDAIVFAKKTDPAQPAMAKADSSLFAEGAPVVTTTKSAACAKSELGSAKRKADSSSVEGGMLRMTTKRDASRESALAKTNADSAPSVAGGVLPSRSRRAGGMTTRGAWGIPWAVLAAGIYCAIALLLLGRLLLGMILSRRLARLSETIEDADATRKLRFRAFASGLETVPRIAESELVSVPATLSVLRPIILLPAHWREWDEAKFDAILAHEVSHVARRDALTQRISLIHRAIFWFSPLAWWLDRQLNELAEEASDEAALGAGADKKRYAETLLGFFADLDAASGRVWWQGVSMADASRAGHAERRVERILEWGGNISMRKSLMVALVAVAAPVIFLAAAVHPVMANGQSAQDKTQSDSKNVIMPGGPKAPALPNVPKGGVAGGVSATPPSGGVPGGVGASAPAAPTFAQVPAGVVAPEALAASTPTAQMGGSSDVQDMEKQLRDAQKMYDRAARQFTSDSVNVNISRQMLAASKKAMENANAALRHAQDEMQQAEAQNQTTTITNGNITMGNGPRYVMMSANSNNVSMSGDEEDLQHARELKKKISGDFIWFERDEKSYVITDPGFIAKAKALFAPEEALAKQQDELGRQQDELGRQQDAVGEQMDGVKVKIRDITPELENIRARLKELNAEGGATQEELGRLQSRLGELQSEVGRSQSSAGVSQSEIGRRQGELGRKQGELGRRQGELGRQQGEIAKKASRELQGMFDDAIAKGIAKPE